MYIEVYIERSQDFQVYVAADAEQWVGLTPWCKPGRSA